MTDNSGHFHTATCNVESGSQFEIGVTEVICQAVDLGGNRGACSFTVIVIGRCSSLKQCSTVLQSCIMVLDSGV